MNNLSSLRRICLLLFVLLLTAALIAQTHAAQVQDRSERKVLSKIAPSYPEPARRYGIKGVVRLEVIIRKDGSDKASKALGGSSFLIETATMAINQWRFAPALEETTEVVKIAFDN
jgi:TonB family protein